MANTCAFFHMLNSNKRAIPTELSKSLHLCHPFDLVDVTDVLRNAFDELQNKPLDLGNVMPFSSMWFEFAGDHTLRGIVATLHSDRVTASAILFDGKTLQIDPFHQSSEGKMLLVGAACVLINQCGARVHERPCPTRVRKSLVRQGLVDSAAELPAWRTVRLRTDVVRDGRRVTISGDEAAEVLTRRLRHHYVRAHQRRLADGRMVPVRAHSRGNRELGSVRTQYLVEHG